MVHASFEIGSLIAVAWSQTHYIAVADLELRILLPLQVCQVLGIACACSSFSFAFLKAQRSPEGEVRLDKQGLKGRGQVGEGGV